MLSTVRHLRELAAAISALANMHARGLIALSGFTMMLAKMQHSVLFVAKLRKVRLSTYMEESFLVKGFTNWKDATRLFARHENCDFHKSSAAALASRVDVGDMLSRQAATEKQQNRQYLLKVLSSIRFLARQGLSLRHSCQVRESENQDSLATTPLFATTPINLSSLIIS